MPAKIITFILLHLKVTQNLPLPATKRIQLSGFYIPFSSLPLVLLYILYRGTLISCWTSHPSRQNQDFLFTQLAMLYLNSPFYHSHIWKNGLSPSVSQYIQKEQLKQK